MLPRFIDGWEWKLTVRLQLTSLQCFLDTSCTMMGLSFFITKGGTITNHPVIYSVYNGQCWCSSHGFSVLLKLLSHNDRVPKRRISYIPWTHTFPRKCNPIMWKPLLVLVTHFKCIKTYSKISRGHWNTFGVVFLERNLGFLSYTFSFLLCLEHWLSTRLWCPGE